MITVGIVNKGRPLSYVQEIIDAVYKQENVKVDKIIISTSKVSEATETLVSPDFSIVEMLENKAKNVAGAKNGVLKKALEVGSTRLFLIEDDVDIKSPQCFDKYLNLLDGLQLGVVNAGYTNGSNYVLTKPSPRIKFMNIPNEMVPAVVTNRHEAGDFLVINLEMNKLNFSEELDYFETSEYMFQCWKYSYIPGLNQFFDVPESWELVGRKPVKTERESDMKKIQADQQKMSELINNGWVIENNVNVIMDYIIGKLSGQTSEGKLE